MSRLHKVELISSSAYEPEFFAVVNEKGVIQAKFPACASGREDAVMLTCSSEMLNVLKLAVAAAYEEQGQREDGELPGWYGQAMGIIAKAEGKAA